MELPDWIVQMLVAGGGGAAIAAGLFKFLGKNWIKNQFSKNLETAKSEISFHAANRMKLHNKEYEVFPEIWARLSDAQESIQAALHEFRRIPDLNHMSEGDFKKWVESTDLEQNEKEAMITSCNRTFCFGRILGNRDIRRAEESYLEFKTYLQKSRIFLSPEIREKFDEIKTLLQQVWEAKRRDDRNAQRDGHVDCDDVLQEAFDIFNDKVKPLMGELENIVQEKLFPDREATK